MINVRELRIGNLLFHGDTIVKVTSIFQTHFACETFDCISRGISRQSNYVGIPLTPEILEACGFERSYNGDDIWKHPDLYFMGDYSLSNFIFKGCQLNKTGSRVDARNFVIMDSLHQLQNLYYAANLKELTYTPLTEKE